MYCFSLIHAVSQAKCQKSYLLNTLVLQELIINLSPTLVPPKINNYSHIYWILTFKIIDQSGCKQTSRSQGLFRWPSNRGSKKPWVRGCHWDNSQMCNRGAERMMVIIIVLNKFSILVASWRYFQRQLPMQMKF
jgi:hypothetical protein